MLKLKEANYIGQYWTTRDNARGPQILQNMIRCLLRWVEAIQQTNLRIALLTSDEKKVDYTIAAGDAGWRTIELMLATMELMLLMELWEPNPQGSISLCILIILCI